MKRKIQRINNYISRRIQELERRRHDPDCPKLRQSEKGWVYAFVDKGRIRYVGITSQTLSQRRHGHIGPYPDCPFAHALAREATGKEGPNKDLLKHRDYKMCYRRGQDRIREMKIIAIRESCGHRRHLLEVAAAIAFKTLNKF